MGEQTGGMRFDKHECPFLFYRVQPQSQTMVAKVLRLGRSKTRGVSLASQHAMNNKTLTVR